MPRQNAQGLLLCPPSLFCSLVHSKFNSNSPLSGLSKVVNLVLLVFHFWVIFHWLTNSHHYSIAHSCRSRPGNTHNWLPVSRLLLTASSFECHGNSSRRQAVKEERGGWIKSVLQTGSLPHSSLLCLSTFAVPEKTVKVGTYPRKSLCHSWSWSPFVELKVEKGMPGPGQSRRIYETPSFMQPLAQSCGKMLALVSRLYSVWGHQIWTNYHFPTTLRGGR